MNPLPRDEQARGRPRTTPVWPLVLAYAAVVSLWPSLVDRLLGVLLEDPAWIARAGMIRHAIFVLLTTALVYVVARTLVAAQRRQSEWRQAAGEAEDRALRLLGTIADHSPDVIFAKDREGRYLLFNREAARITGRSSAEVLGHDDRAIFPLAQAETVRANDERVMRQDQAQTFNEVLDTTEGQLTYLATKGPLHDRDGRVSGMFGISRNITALLAGQQQVRDSERRYHFMFDASPMPMWAFDRQTLRYLAVNDAAVAHYGYSREQFLAMTIADIRPPDERDRLFAIIEQWHLDQPQRPGSQRSWTHKRKDGSLIQVEVSTSDVDLDGRAARLVLLNDVTERIRLEDERAAALTEMTTARDLFNDVLERIDDGFVALDADWRYTYVNPRAATMFGRASPDELIGRHIWTEFPEGIDQPFARVYRDAMANQQPASFEDYYAPWDRWFENRVYPSPQGLSIYFTDITERKRAQQVLQDQERGFRSLAEQVPAIIYRTTTTGESPRYVSPYLRSLGYSTEEWMAQPDSWQRRLHPDDVDRVLAERHAGEASGGEFRLEYRLRDASGRWRHFRDMARRVEPDDGSTPYLQGVAVEVTDIVEAEIALRDSEAQLRLSEQRYRLAAVEDHVWEWDGESNVLITPPAMWALLGLEVPSVEHTLDRLFEMMPAEDVKRMKQALRASLRDGVPYELEFRARDVDGEIRWFHSSGQPLRNARGRTTYMAGTTVEITERKQAELALRESEAYRRRLFEQLADGVLLLDRERRIIDANPQALSMLACAAGALPELRLDQLLSPHDRERLDDDLREALSGQRSLLEWDVVRRDGSRFPAEVSVRAMDGERCIAMLREVAARRSTEKALLSYQLELSELTHRLLTQEKLTTQRVAQLLHDSIGQTLAVARLHLDAAIAKAAKAMPAELRSECQTISGLLDQAMREARQMLADLRPPLLDEQGLAAALDNEMRQRSSAAGEPDLLLEADDELLGRRWPGDVEYGSFMIAREAIANARRHARASMVRVLLSGDAGSMTLEVIDDGVGIPLHLAAGRPGHLGMVGMRERAIAMGAQLDVRHGDDGGTQVRLHWTA